jgi:chromosome segregation ATPase
MKSGVVSDMDDESNVLILKIVQKLKDIPIIDRGRLDYIQKTLEQGRTLYQSDKKYIQEQSRLLEKIEDEKRKANDTLQSLDKLRQSKLEDIKRLEKLKGTALQNSKRYNKSKLAAQGFDAITKPLQEKIKVTENEIDFLDSKYDKLKQEIDQQNQIQETISLIKKLHEEEIGDYTRLEKINILLEDDEIISQSDIDYLNEKHSMLQQIDANKKVNWTIDIITKLQEYEVGDYKRLEKIKTALENGHTVNPEEVSYLKEKFNQMLIIKKQK